MKVAIFLIFLLTNIAFTENQLMWDDPVAINNGSEIQNFQCGYCLLNNSGLAIANWPNLVTSNLLLYSAFSNDFGKTWSIPQQLTPSTETYLLSQSATVIPFFPLNQQGRSVFCWIDSSSAPPKLNVKAALFDSSSGWTTAPLATFSPPLEFPVESFIKNAVIGNNNFSVVIWMEYTGPDYNLKSAYNDGTNSSWQVVATDIATGIDGFANPVLGMSPSGEHLFVFWRESTLSLDFFSLKISSFNFGTHSWGAPETLVANDGIGSVLSSPIVNDSGYAMIPWAEKSTTTVILKIATFNGSTWSTQILDTGPSDTEFSFTPFSGLSLNANNHAVFSWSINDPTLSSATQKISYFDGSTWSSPFTFSNTMLSGSGIFPLSTLNELDQTFLLYQEDQALLGSFFQMPPSFSGIMPQSLDSSALILPYSPLIANNSEALATWFHQNMDNSLSVKTALCSSGIWTVFPVPGANSPLNPSFGSFPWIARTDNGAAIVGWGQQGSTNFFVSSGSISGSGPLPPSGGSGFQTSTKFLISTDLINVLSWTPSPTPGVFYNIYRNGTLVGTSAAPSFNDHQQIPKQPATYSITAVDASGAQSPPLLFVVTPYTKYQK